MNKKRLKNIALVSLGILLFLSLIALGSSGKKTRRNIPEKQAGSISVVSAEQTKDTYNEDISHAQSPAPASAASSGQQVYTPTDIQVADYFAPVESSPSVSGSMEVHFIDVGQGDATLITCDGEAMLIDAGDNSKGTTVQYYLKKQGVDSLKYLILTHPDADHIGGADVIVTKYDIGTVFESYYKKPAYHKASDELAKALSYRYMTPIVPAAGNAYNLGEASFTFIGPIGYSDEPNNASLALILQYGNVRFLFTGDAESEEESAIINSGYDIKADVYKVGHHGSKSSSNDYFLRAVMPRYAVISCGVNEYGHPNSEVLQRLYNVGASIYRTDQSGNITAITDGINISWSAAQSGSDSIGGDNTASLNDSVTVTSHSNGDIAPQNEVNEANSEKKWYYVVTTSGYFHQSPCEKIREGENPQTHYWYEGTRDELIAKGLKSCRYCNP